MPSTSPGPPEPLSTEDIENLGRWRTTVVDPVGRDVMRARNRRWGGTRGAALLVVQTGAPAGPRR